jgi:hypothetical protein
MDKKDNSVNIRYQSIGNIEPDEEDAEIEVSYVRWYVITVVSLANILNVFLWATWGPISQSAHVVYDWTDNDVFWMVNLGNIFAFITVFFGVYLVDCKGRFQTFEWKRRFSEFKICIKMCRNNIHVYQ